MDVLLPLLIQAGGYLRVACEILLLAFLIYSALLFVRGTRAVTILAGFITVVIVLNLLSRFLGLDVIEWLMMKIWTFLALSVLIIFQPEIRRAFAQIGSQQPRLLLHGTAKRERQIVDMLVEATFFLSDHSIGALIAIEREIGTRTYAETGTYIRAPLNTELLTTLFFPNTPLHDGGVIIRDGVIVAAGCIFPLTQGTDLSRSLGTRHRAGVGITEETDAVAIIVSEETGAASLAYRGRLIRGVSRDRLQRHLTNFLTKKRVAQGLGGLQSGIAELQATLAVDPDEQEEPLS